VLRLVHHGRVAVVAADGGLVAAADLLAALAVVVARELLRLKREGRRGGVTAY